MVVTTHTNANKPDSYRELRGRLRSAAGVEDRLMVQWFQMKLFYTSKKLLSPNKRALRKDWKGGIFSIKLKGWGVFRAPCVLSFPQAVNEPKRSSGP